MPKLLQTKRIRKGTRTHPKQPIVCARLSYAHVPAPDADQPTELEPHTPRKNRELQQRLYLINELAQRAVASSVTVFNECVHKR